jgi:hypothetical protein
VRLDLIKSDLAEVGALLKMFDEARVRRDRAGRFADQGGGPSQRQPGQVPSAAPVRTRYASSKVFRMASATEAPTSTFGEVDHLPQRPRKMAAAEYAGLRQAAQAIARDRRPAYLERAAERGLIPEGATPRAVRLAYAHAVSLAQHDAGLHRYDYKLSAETKVELTPLLPFMRYARKRMANELGAEQGPALASIRAAFGTPFADGRTDVKIKAVGAARARRDGLIEAARAKGLIGETDDPGDVRAAYDYAVRQTMLDQGTRTYRGARLGQPRLLPFVEMASADLKEVLPTEGQARVRMAPRSELADYAVRAPDPVKVADIMREFKRGRLRSGRNGPVVKDRQQAMAIALSMGRRASPEERVAKAFADLVLRKGLATLVAIDTTTVARRARWAGAALNNQPQMRPPTTLAQKALADRRSEIAQRARYQRTRLSQNIATSPIWRR